MYADGEKYGDGSNLPVLHANPETNRNLQLGVLCANLDAARSVLEMAMLINGTSTEILQLKVAAMKAIDSTHPRNLPSRPAARHAEPPRGLQAMPGGR